MTWQHLSDTRPKARKRHQCFICRTAIWRGTIYRRSAFTFDGSAYVIKEHVECSRVAAKWCDSFDYPDGYQGEDVLEAMEEGLHDPILSRNSDFNVYSVGDLTREERIVWGRFRRSQAHGQIRRMLRT